VCVCVCLDSRWMRGGLRYDDLTRKSLPRVQQVWPCSNTIIAPSPRPQHSINKHTNRMFSFTLSNCSSVPFLLSTLKSSFCLLGIYLEIKLIFHSNSKAFQLIIYDYMIVAFLYLTPWVRWTKEEQCACSMFLFNCHRKGQMMSDSVATASKMHMSFIKALELWHLTLTWDRCCHAFSRVTSKSLHTYACNLVCWCTITCIQCAWMHRCLHVWECVPPPSPLTGLHSVPALLLY